MSKFAHGIRAFDVYSEKHSRIVLLGNEYIDRPDDYLKHYESLLWMTYRKDFQKMDPYEYTSDAGWGCMLRSVQMILGQVLQRHYLKKSWRLDLGVALPKEFKYILKWMADHDMPDECLYSIHNMVKVGMQYDKLPGEWYGPTTAALVTRDLVSLHCKQFKGQVGMYVPQDGVIYSDQVYQVCTEPIDVDVEVDAVDENGNMYDPLLNPPVKLEQKDMPWQVAMFILVPLRLGLDKLNEDYLPGLHSIFKMPQCVGIIGGKRAHSVYFVGFHEDKFHILDPHTVHPTTELNASFPTATHLRTIHSSSPLIMESKYIDPSLAIGFYCRDKQDYLDFTKRVSTAQNIHKPFPFSIASTQPNYSQDIDDCIDSDSQSEGTMENQNVDDEYIMI